MFEFDMLEKTETQRHRIPRKTFYLLFRHNGYDKIGDTVLLKDAIARAKEIAQANPGIEYVLMKAEKLITTKPENVREIPLRPVEENGDEV